MDYKKILSGIKDSYNKAGQSYFDMFHDDISQHKEDQVLLDNFLKELPLKPVICDMECGPAAQYGGFIAYKCSEMHALDISDKNLELAAKKFPNLKYHCMDMCNTQFKNNTFDAVISFYAIFHIPKEQTKLVFKEFKRILKPGGKLLVVTHKGGYENTITNLWGHENLSLFANFHNEKEIAAAASATGFKTDKLSSSKSFYEFPEERLIFIGES